MSLPIVCVVALLTALLALIVERNRMQDHFIKQQLHLTRNFGEEITRWNAERDQWATERLHNAAERQTLLDRIQAPSFNDFKAGEIRKLKIEKQAEPVPMQELL